MSDTDIPTVPKRRPGRPTLDRTPEDIIQAKRDIQRRSYQKRKAKAAQEAQESQEKLDRITPLMDEIEQLKRVIEDQKKIIGNLKTMYLQAI